MISCFHRLDSILIVDQIYILKCLAVLDYIFVHVISCFSCYFYFCKFNLISIASLIQFQSCIFSFSYRLSSVTLFPCIYFVCASQVYALSGLTIKSLELYYNVFTQQSSRTRGIGTTKMLSPHPLRTAMNKNNTMQRSITPQR